MNRVHYAEPPGAASPCGAWWPLSGRPSTTDRLAVTCRRCLRALGAPSDNVLVADLDVSVRAQNWCSNLGIDTVGELRALSDADLLRKRMDRPSLRELRAVAAGLPRPAKALEHLQRHCLHPRWPTLTRDRADCPDCGASREPRPSPLALLDRHRAEWVARRDDLRPGAERARAEGAVEALDAVRAALVGGGVSP